MFEKYIEINDIIVRAFLDEMARATSPKSPSMLLETSIVGVFRIKNQMPDTIYYRHFALQTIIVDIISTQCNHHRLLYQLPELDSTESFNAVGNTLLQTLRADNQALMSWTWLYYRFVRVDLDLSANQLAQMAGLVARTVRRQIERGVNQLTQQLIKHETQARMRFHQQHLLAMLPERPTPQFIGRNTEVQSLMKILQKLSPNHLVVSGEAGVGKTAFVREIVSTLIQSVEIDAAIWIDKPQSLAEICDAIIPNNNDPALKLNTYSLVCKLIVVIDEIKWLEYEDVRYLLNQLRSAIVFLITDTIPGHMQTIARYKVKPLNQENTNIFIQRYSAIQSIGNWSLDPQDIARIAQEVGGKPQQIINAVHNYWKQNE